jgi:glycine hydroxymethyltransferase
VHQSPFPYADAVTMTTHKTLRGPRGAMIFANKNSIIAAKNKIDIVSAIDKAVFPGLQGGPHDHQTAGIAQCLHEALQPQFKRYAETIVQNAKVLAKHLKELGFRIISGGTDNHLFLIDLTNWNITGKEAEELLEKVGIIVNRNAIPHDPRYPFNPSGIRIGTPAITTRGMKAHEMKKIALLIHGVINREGTHKRIKEEVLSLVKEFPLLY